MKVLILWLFIFPATLTSGIVPIYGWLAHYEITQAIEDADSDLLLVANTQAYVTDERIQEYLRAKEQKLVLYKRKLKKHENNNPWLSLRGR